MRSRLYRVFALITAVVGLIIFVILYFQNIEGRMDEAIREPQTIVLIVLPFLPAAVLSIMAERAQKRFVSYMQNAGFTAGPASVGDDKKGK